MPDSATTSRWWRIHYLDRDPVEVACCPEANRAEILESYAGASAAEPFEPSIRQPSAPMTGDEAQAILAWLARIEEDDQTTIDGVLAGCRNDPEVRGYFLRRAGEFNAWGGGMGGHISDANQPKTVAEPRFLPALNLNFFERIRHG